MSCHVMSCHAFFLKKKKMSRKHSAIQLRPAKGTSKDDLIQILQNCQKCFNLTNKGTNIISHDQLITDIVDKTKPKQCFIVNTQNDWTTTGHWFVLIVYLSNFQRHVILADGLSIVKTNQDVMSNIRLFCRNNGLKLTFIQTRYQRMHSKECGKLALYFVYRLSMYNFHTFMNIHLTMSNTSLKTNELFLLRRVDSHFNVN